MKIIVFDYNLSNEKTETFENSNIQTNLFKCIHINNNIGSFIYLTEESNVYYFNIMFKEYDISSSSFSDYLNNVKYEINFNGLTYKNSNFIKYSENKICFITTAN